MWGKLGIAALLVALTLALEHYLIWRVLGGRVMRPPWTYIAGVATLGAGFSEWALAAGVDWQVVAAFWFITVAGGGSVMACYHLDRWLGKRAMRATRQQWGTAKNETRDDSGD